MFRCRSFTKLPVVTDQSLAINEKSLIFMREKERNLLVIAKYFRVSTYHFRRIFLIGKKSTEIS